MKLVPMANELDTASASPIYLSSIAVGERVVGDGVGSAAAVVADCGRFCWVLVKGSVPGDDMRSASKGGVAFFGRFSPRALNAVISL